jgi:predicted homoserine dehydrogenase-like protein
VATAKRDLKPGEMLDGEGGYAVWANAIPASKSLAIGGLPIGLAHNVRLKRAVAKDTIVRFEDVELERDLDVVAMRREMEQSALGKPAKAA